MAVMIVAVMIIAAGCGSSAGNVGNTGNAENAGNAGNAENAGNAGIIPENNTAAEDDAGLPDPEAGAVETAESAQSSSEETETIKEAEAGSEDSEAFETVDSDKTDQVVIEEGSDSISQYFTNEQLEHIRQALGIPDDLPVEVEVSSPYYWEGGGMDLVQVDFYHDGEYAAGAACKPYTEEIARNIYQYFE